MGKIAFLFPGQGSQAIGMGLSVHSQYPEVQPLYKEAEEILGWRSKSGKNFLETLQTGPEEALRQTEVAQPALYVTGYAACQALRSRHMDPEAAAGHSIGEYAALAAAGVFEFAEGLRLVQQRGELMNKATRDFPGAMAAILRLTAAQVEEVCTGAKSEGICMPVNFNTPDQTVIAGQKAAVEKAVVLAKEKGGKAILLNVAGGFHSPLMKQPAQEMRRVLEKASFRHATIPVCMNVDGKLHTDGREIQEALMAQLDSPVQWVKSMETLKRAGCSVFVECGSGRILSGLLRGIDNHLQSFTTESAEAVSQVLDVIGTARKGMS